MYILKPNTAEFQVMDGPFARRTYRHGMQYDKKDIPPEERHRFAPAVPEQEEKSGGKQK